MPGKRKHIRVVLPWGSYRRDVKLNPCNESLSDPLARLEVELPFRALPGPAARGLNIFEEARPVRPVAGDACGGEGVVGGRREEVGLPFGGRGVEGAVLELEDLDFAGFGGGVEGYGAEGCEEGSCSGGGGGEGEGDVEEGEAGGCSCGGGGRIEVSLGGRG